MGQLFTSYIKLFLMKRDPTIMTETYNSIIVYKCINKIINSIFNTSKNYRIQIYDSLISCIL